MPIMVVRPPVGKTRTAMLAAIAVSPQRVPYEARFSTAWNVFGTSFLTPLRPSLFTELELPSRGVFGTSGVANFHKVRIHRSLHNPTPLVSQRTSAGLPAAAHRACFSEGGGKNALVGQSEDR